ncbi:hypothetical protein EON65_33875 [archaeon]|nr:MAG: hypothetical protein EON65_33875 [archaeon]
MTERTLQFLRKDAEGLQEELDIANMDPKEAHTRFVQRVNFFKTGSKSLEEKCTGLRDEIGTLRRTLEDLNSSNNMTQDSSAEDQERYDLLVKRDQEMSAFIDSFDETVGSVMREQKEAQFMIVALLEHIGECLFPHSMLLSTCV